MALPALVRTWRFQVNNAMVPQGTITAMSQHTLFALKEALKGNGAWTDSAGAAAASAGNWVVNGSCDGSGGAGSFGNNDAVDRWVAQGNLIWNNSGSNHSWIVLEQAGIAANFQICIDLNNNVHPHDARSGDRRQLKTDFGM